MRRNSSRQPGSRSRVILRRRGMPLAVLAEIQRSVDRHSDDGVDAEGIEGVDLFAVVMPPAAVIFRSVPWRPP